MNEKIPYWKSNAFLQAFVHKRGKEGCAVCTDNNLRLSLERAPPPRIVRTAAPKVTEYREPFDLQDIPVAVRRLGMWQAAKMFDKWFAGSLNYSVTNKDTIAEINQNGQPYPASMIDKDSISLEWVLKFPRAKAARDQLVSDSILTTPKAMDALKKVLSQHTSSACPILGRGAIMTFKSSTTNFNFSE